MRNCVSTSLKDEKVCIKNDEFCSPAARKAWVVTVVAMVKSLNIDGVTFDFESPIANGAPEAETYVTIIKETTAALHAAIPGSQV